MVRAQAGERQDIEAVVPLEKIDRTTENRIETHNRMEQILTPEQREKMRSFRHGGKMGW